MQRYLRQAKSWIKARRGDFVFNILVAALFTLGAWVITSLLDAFANPTVSEWLIPIVCVAAFVGIIAFPIIRELRRPRAVVQFGSGVKVGRMIFPVDPVKAAKGKYFEDQSLNIYSLIKDGRITGKTCKNCQIHGPAVLILDKTSRAGGQFHHNENASPLIPLIDPQNPPAGVIIVVNSSFDYCDFYEIGLVEFRKIQYVEDDSESSGLTVIPPSQSPP